MIWRATVLCTRKGSPEPLPDVQEWSSKSCSKGKRHFQPVRNSLFPVYRHKGNCFPGQVKSKPTGISRALVMPFVHSGSRHTAAITVQMDRGHSSHDFTTSNVSHAQKKLVEELRHNHLLVEVLQTTQEGRGNQAPGSLRFLFCPYPVFGITVSFCFINKSFCLTNK